MIENFNKIINNKSFDRSILSCAVIRIETQTSEHTQI